MVPFFLNCASQCISVRTTVLHAQQSSGFSWSHGIPPRNQSLWLCSASHLASFCVVCKTRSAGRLEHCKSTYHHCPGPQDLSILLRPLSLIVIVVRIRLIIVGPLPLRTLTWALLFRLLRPLLRSVTGTRTFCFVRTSTPLGAIVFFIG